MGFKMVKVSGVDVWMFESIESRYRGIALKISGRCKSSRNTKDELVIFAISLDALFLIGDKRAVEVRHFPREIRNLDLLIRSAVHDMLFSEKD